MEEITIESLATVAGAVPATALLLQFLKVFWSPSGAVLRQLSALVAAVLVVAATVVINDSVTFAGITAAVFAGITAGLAASQAYEVVTEGISYSITSE